MADMSWRGGWSSVCIVGEYIGPCNYTIEIDFDVITDDMLAQNTAYNRVKHLFEHVYQDSILICVDNPLISVLKKQTKSTIITFPLEPLDLIIAGVSWHKINNITENHLQIERIRIHSDQSDDVILNISEDFMQESVGIAKDVYEEYGKRAWWFRSDYGVEDWLEHTDDKLKVHYNIEDWPEYLTWNWRPEKSEKTFEHKADNVVNFGKWKPEVIPGDKT